MSLPAPALDPYSHDEAVTLRHGRPVAVVLARTVEEVQSTIRLAAAHRRRGTTLLDDVAVPCARVPDLLSAIQAIADDQSVDIATLGHAGDGNVRAAIRLGGTVTGEHGVGTLKRRFLAEELAAGTLRLLAAIKGVFDPAGTLNPERAL